MLLPRENQTNTLTPPHPPMASRRLDKVNELMKREIGSFVQKEFDWPGTIVSILDVEITEDLKEGRVWVGVVGRMSPVQVIEKLTRNKGVIQNAVSKRVILRNTPRLTFKHDDSAKRGVDLVNLLDDIDKMTPGVKDGLISFRSLCGHSSCYHGGYCKYGDHREEHYISQSHIVLPHISRSGEATVLYGYHQQYAEDVEEHVYKRACPFRNVGSAISFAEQRADDEEYSEEHRVSYHGGEEHSQVKHLHRKRPNTEVHFPNRPIRKEHRQQYSQDKQREHQRFQKSRKTRGYPACGKRIFLIFRIIFAVAYAIDRGIDQPEEQDHRKREQRGSHSPRCYPVGSVLRIKLRVREDFAAVFRANSVNGKSAENCYADSCQPIGDILSFYIVYVSIIF